MRAIVPSSFTTSASTPGGSQAGEARQVDRGLGVAGALEHAALAVAQREDVAGPGEVLGPGGVGRGARARWSQRSAAEMPVLVPWRASTDTVNAVRWLSVLSATISGRRSSSSRWPSTGMQITPLVWRIMNAIASGVMASAAMMRSPSFSRSASSTTMTSSPRAMAATAFSMSVKGMVVSYSLTCVVRRRSTYFASTSTSRLTGITRSTGTEGGDGEGVRDDRDVEPVASFVQGSEGGDGEADAVDGDRALLDDVAQDVGRSGEGHAGRAVGQRRRGRARCRRASTWPCTTWPPSRSARRTGRSRLTGSPARSVPRRGAVEGLGDRVGGPAVVAELDHREAAAVHRDRGAELGVVEHVGAPSISMRAPPALGVTARTVPSSSTMPVNISRLRAVRRRSGRLVVEAHVGTDPVTSTRRQRGASAMRSGPARSSAGRPSRPSSVGAT